MVDSYAKTTEKERAENLGGEEVVNQKIHVRWMIKRDLPEVLDIEKRSFDAPWTQKEFEKELQDRSIIGMVAEVDTAVLGYMLYRLCKDKLQLLNFAVDPLYRHEGIGTTMINKLKGKLSPRRRRNIELLIAESNLDAQLFFKEMNFIATNIEKGFFDDGQDAYMFDFFTDEIG